MRVQVRIIIDEQISYDGPWWKWKVISDTNAGFVLSGRSHTFRQACRQSRRAYKRLKGIDFIPFEQTTPRYEK